MGILGWFMNRPAPFDTGRVSETMVRRATEKAIALTNPRLSVLSSCHARLAPAVSTTIRYLRAMVDALPAAKAVSPTAWSSDPALRAFFVAPSDIPAALGRSDNVRTLFDKYPPGRRGVRAPGHGVERATRPGNCPARRNRSP